MWSRNKIDHRSSKERKHLADNQAADDGNTEWPAKLRSGAGPEGQRKAPRNAAMVVIMIGRKRSTHALIDRFSGAICFRAFNVQGEIDHHDRVLFHDADKQDNPDQSRSSVRSFPVSIIARIAPTPAEGRVERIVMG